MDQKTEDILQAIAKAMDKGLGGAGFAVLVFKIGEPNLCNYVSNVERDDMKAAMLEVIARWEGRGHDAPGGVQ